MPLAKNLTKQLSYSPFHSRSSSERDERSEELLFGAFDIDSVGSDLDPLDQILDVVPKELAASAPGAAVPPQ